MADGTRARPGALPDSGAATDAMASLFEKGAQAWLGAHQEAIAGMQAIMSDWLERRREAIDASRRTIEQMSGCRDVAELLRIQQEWLGDSLRRSAADFEAINDRVAAAARRTTGRFEETLRTVTDASRRANEAMLEAAGNKPQRRARR
jgi:Phasin protein